MEKKKFINNFVIVTGGNLLNLGANIILGLVLPILLNVEDYGYYKLYTLYVGYCGLLHFGFVDGILLTYGGTDYQQLDKQKFRTFTKAFGIVEAVLGCIVIFGATLLLSGEYRTVLIFVGINLVAYCVSLYYQYISQATSRFTEFAMRKSLNAIATILLVVVLFAVKRQYHVEIDYSVLLIALECIAFALMGWYLWTYRDITFGEGEPIKNICPEIKSICEKGIKLTIAYEVANFILLMDRQFVSVLFPIEIYGQYSFAYNLLSCVTALITAISTVLFPMLKRMNEERIKRTMSQGVAGISAIVCFFLAGYPLLKVIVNILLPAYKESMQFFYIVYPVIAFTSVITILMFNYYKVLDRIMAYFKRSVLALLIAVALNFIAYGIWKTPHAISIASVLSAIIWYCLVASDMAQCCNSQWKREFVYIVIMIALYYLIMSLRVNWGIQITIYTVFYAIITYFFHHDALKQLIV